MSSCWVLQAIVSTFTFSLSEMGNNCQVLSKKIYVLINKKTKNSMYKGQKKILKDISSRLLCKGRCFSTLLQENSCQFHIKAGFIILQSLIHLIHSLTKYSSTSQSTLCKVPAKCRRLSWIYNLAPKVLMGLSSNACGPACL